MTGQLAAVVFVVGLIASIMVHEWGHFVTARRFGMRVDRFFLGFGPTLWSTRRGETEYGVKALPLGGFVRIKGMAETDERLPSVPEAMARRIGAGEDASTALAELLDERGTPSGLADRIIGRFGRTMAAADDPDDASGSLAVEVGQDPAHLALRLIASEVPPTGRVGDLNHRLLRGDEGRFFHDRPAWQRAVVLASGSALHFLQAILLVFLGWLLVGPTVAVPGIADFADAETTDGQVVASVAEAAGLEVGDRIVAIDGRRSDDFEQVRAYIRDNPGMRIDLLVQRPGTEEQLEFTVTPAPYTDPDTGEEVGLLGFLPQTETRPMDADEALYATFVGDGSFTRMLTGTFAALGNVFGPEGIGDLFGQLTGEQERQIDGGISLVGATQAANQGTSQFGLLFFFALLASVNVFVGIFNALPLPPLDGGHLAVLGVEEAVNLKRRREGEPADFRIDPRMVASIAVPVIVFVLTISLGLLWLDITNPLTF